MLLHLWGTDFRRSSSEFRAQLFIDPPSRKALIERCIELGFRDLVYLATCNRIEFYTTASDLYSDTRSLWLSLLAYLGLDRGAFYQGYHLEGKSALRHLLRVASSLESMVVGEPQILGQLKSALSDSEALGFLVDRQLKRAFCLAFESAKKVRTLTGIDEKPVSIATLGLAQVQAMTSLCPVGRIAVVSRSPISIQVLDWFGKNRPDVSVTWINRSVDKLREFAQGRNITLMSLGEFLSVPFEFSHLFTATSSSQVVFGRDFFKSLRQARRVVVDFAEPPDVDHRAATDRGCELVSIESLARQASKNTKEREASVAAAERIIEDSLREFFRTQKEAPILSRFSQIESELSAQAAQAMVSFDSCGADQKSRRTWVEKLLRKNLHDARAHLRDVLRTTAGIDQSIG